MRALYTLTVFLNSFLLFLVQPLIAKRLLPVFGGSPLVWNTCLLFFQLVLLLGYLYAHLSFKWAGSKRQPWVHLGLLAVALLLLPIGLKQGLTDMYEHAQATNPHSLAAQPGLMLLLMLFASVGLPFFALSSGAPIIQRWFSHTDDPRAHDPYFLYQASNLGSMLALVFYPLYFERVFGLQDQSKWWSFGYVGLVVFLGGVAYTLSRKPIVEEEVVEVDNSPAPSWHDRLLWMFLSAGPSALLLAVTVYLSTNVAPIPLLWVIPLALYLITFIIAFAAKPIFPARIATYLAVAMIFPVIVLDNIENSFPVAITAPIHLGGFFLVALACHMQIGQSRPKASHLTEFYLWISVGGVVGGFFSAIVAPMVFTTLAEYPIAMVACFLAIGLAMKPKAAWVGDFAMPIAGGLFVATLANHFPSGKDQYSWVYAVGATMLITSLRPVRFAVALAAIFIGMFFGSPSAPKIFAERSFFGVHFVESDHGGDRHKLMNGNTTHGTQWMDEARRRQPTTYYGHPSAVGRAILGLEARSSLKSMAVVGLGSGTLAAYGQPGMGIDYYEIDAGIERIARNPKYFSYLTDSKAKINVLLGDARLRLQEAPTAKYDLLALDAFASDAIPVHLLTVESFRLYKRTLRPHGILMVHVSNRYLRLAPVVAAIAKECDLSCLSGEDFFDASTGRYELGDYTSWWVMVGDREALAPYAVDKFWKPLAADGKVRPWTDDYSNVLSAMILLGDVK